jgi:hypothetical protein
MANLRLVPSADAPAYHAPDDAEKHFNKPSTMEVKTEKEEQMLSPTTPPAYMSPLRRPPLGAATARPVPPPTHKRRRGDDDAHAVAPTCRCDHDLAYDHNDHAGGPGGSTQALPPLVCNDRWGQHWRCGGCAAPVETARCAGCGRHRRAASGGCPCDGRRAGQAAAAAASHAAAGERCRCPSDTPLVCNDSWGMHWRCKPCGVPVEARRCARCRAGVKAGQRCPCDDGAAGRPPHRQRRPQLQQRRRAGRVALGEIHAAHNGVDCNVQM